jgi:tetratricopeptide (TPR) repeat protein
VRALAIREKALGPEHPDVALSLNNLAIVYERQGRYGEAEAAHARALPILEKALGPEHPHVASSLSGLATVYERQGRYGEAEAANARALAILEKALGPEHPRVAYSLSNLALVYEGQGVVALQRPDEISILVGNLAEHTITAPLDISTLLDARTMYDVCIYDSELDGWQPGEINRAEDIGTVALSIEMGGYRLISLRPR